MNKEDVMQEVQDKVVEASKTPIVPVAPVQTVSKKTMWFLISIIILLGVSLTYLSYLFLGNNKEVVKNNPAENKATSVETSESEGITDDPMKDWKTYDGKSFSFRYPEAWAEEKGADKYERSRAENIDVVNLRISQNAVFQASYVNKKAQQILQDNSGAMKKTTVGGLEATSIETIGVGDSLPEGYSVLLFAIKATEDTSYQISFSGYRKDFSDTLVNQILSTFEFSNSTSNEKLKTDGSFYVGAFGGSSFSLNWSLIPVADEVDFPDNPNTASNIKEPVSLIKIDANGIRNVINKNVFNYGVGRFALPCTEDLGSYFPEMQKHYTEVCKSIKSPEVLITKGYGWTDGREEYILNLETGVAKRNLDW